MKKRIGIFRPVFWLLIVVCLLLTVPAYFYNKTIFYIEAAALFLVYIFVIFKMLHSDNDIERFLSNMGALVSSSQKDSLSELPLPVFVVREDGEIIWCSDICTKYVLGGLNFAGHNISEIAQITLGVACPREGYDIEYGGKQYTAFVAKGLSDLDNVYMIYLFDDDALKTKALEYDMSRLSVLIIVIDSYDDMVQTAKANDRSNVINEIAVSIEKYVTENGGVIHQTERDRYVAMLEERNMEQIMQNRFAILDKVRSIEFTENFTPTLSIGVGRIGENLRESENLARQALEMAIGRGGDQAAVKTEVGYEFYGGISKGIEKRTKVKSRVIASAISELIHSSDNVIIMGHRFADLDCLGAAVGLYQPILSMGKKAMIAINSERNLVELLLEKLKKNGYEDAFPPLDVILESITKKTLLIVVDTHNPQILEYAEIFNACKHVVVIDHHRRMVSAIDNATIFYHEPFSSSASEMVTELVQYFGEKHRIGRQEAEALLAGIMLDTKNFIIRTGVRTFEAAAYLRKIGADTVEVRKLFSSSMENYQHRSRIIASAEIYHNCAISTSAEAIDDIKLIAPQAADELLNISDVAASFVVFETGDGGVSISARSMGAMNVQVVMERLGGGGHHTMAAAQFVEVSLENVRQMLLEAIDAHEETQKK